MRAWAVDIINQILAQKKKLLTEIYFDLQLHFEEGSNDEMKIGKAKEIAELLNIHSFSL